MCAVLLVKSSHSTFKSDDLFEKCIDVENVFESKNSIRKTRFKKRIRPKQKLRAHPNFHDNARTAEFFPIARINSGQTGILAGLLRSYKKKI